MSSSAPPSVEQKPSTPPPPRRSPVKWLVGALAAAVVVIAAVASIVLWLQENDEGHSAGGLKPDPRASASVDRPSAPPSASSGTGGTGPASTGPDSTGTPLDLTVEPQQGRCLLPSPDRLKTGAALAFEGTVARIDAASRTAVVDVTKWLFADGFGGTDTVRIRLPQAGTESTPTFEKGHTYLVAATGQGEVMGCGFTGEKSGDLSTLYGRAFL